MRFLKILKHGKNEKILFDKWLAVAVVVLSAIGLIAVYDSSVVTAFRDFHDPYYFVKSQGMFLVIGIILMFVVSRVPYKVWYKLSVPLLVATLILLVAVFIPGIGVKIAGARRWVNFGFVKIQPTELSKLTLVLYLSAWFSVKEKKRFVPFLVLLGLVLGLVVLQPDMGTAIIIMSMCLLLYFLSDAPLTHFLALIPAAGIALLFLAVAAPYRFARISTFFNHQDDPLGTSYHVRQILIALGSGGLFGVGLGKSRQKYEYLPEANTDSIFAIIAEEVGFLGGIVVIGICIFITIRGFLIAKSAPDRFGQLLASGITIWFAAQTLVNLASMVAIVPLTGVPLPLVSYGGSNLISMLVGFGILLNISRYTHKKA